MLVVFFFISFLASVAGAICGIGGGVIIKPALDFFGAASVPTISFLSGCTVLSMSAYSVGKSMLSGEKKVDTKIGTPLAIGAAVGGILGNSLFAVIKNVSGNANIVGAIQSGCLAIITFYTLICTVNKGTIQSKRISGAIPCICIGLGLGLISSFLGIGGGPINLVVLFFCFGMDTKTAAANSLYIILFSQVTNLLTTLITRAVPPFQLSVLLLMIGGGIGGGIVGRMVNKRINNQMVERLFIILMGIIILISIFNTKKYLGF